MKNILLIIITILLFTLAVPGIIAQESQTENGNWFMRHFDQRIYSGFYSSFGDEKANILQAGYDAVFNLIDITPAWSLLDFSLGMDVLFVRDQIQKETKDNFGHIRHTDNRMIFGFEFNWCARLYFLQIPKIRTSIFVEGLGMTLVVYTKPYPGGGTHVNIGTHLGLGMKFRINDVLNAYTTIRLFSHTSNGQAEATNPALDMAGLIVGLQF